MNPKVKSQRRQKIRYRIRRKVGEGTAQKPRLSVFRSNTEIYVQLIDDNKGQTLLPLLQEIKILLRKKEQKRKKANWLVLRLQEKQLNLGLKEVIFDRGGYFYHGRVKAVAEGAREGGLTILNCRLK